MELLYIERSVVIRNKGSIEFSEEEQASDIVLVDIKCEAINGTIYYNTKTLPPYGFYGSVTLFGGATVRKRIPLEFVYQRVIDFETDYRRLRCYLTKLEDMLQSIGNSVIAPIGVPPVGDGEPRDSFDYRGLPYSKLKINSERLAQYTVIVRSYKEVDTQCKSVSKSDDPTKGEPEYPSPLPIPPDGEFPAGLPNPDAPYPGVDPNDFEPRPQPGYPNPVDFGVRLELSTSAGSPNNCTADVIANENFRWQEAGPPPYTVEFGFLPLSPCAGKGHGYRIVASDGTKSQTMADGATVFGVEIITDDYIE